MHAQHVVDILLESCADSRRKEANRRDILRKLEAVRKKPGLSAHYAQLLSGPWGVIPSYAQEDPSCDWWASDEAEALKDTLTDMLAKDSTYGVKPGGPTRVYPGATQSWQRTNLDVKP